MRFTLRTLLLALPLLALSCEKDPDPPSPPGGGGGGGNGAVYDPTPYALDIPANFPPMVVPPDNPITAKGVELGRFLFYEERLSGNNTQSCGSCHSPQTAFTDDGNQFSTGIDGAVGTRNSMALINLGWDNFYFWDGRAATLEQQVLEPVVNPIEMHETWPNAVAKLQADTAYQDLFIEAFDTDQIDSVLVARAIAQFLRTMISANSKLDKVLRGEAFFTQEEQRGVTLTQLEGGDPTWARAGRTERTVSIATHRRWVCSTTDNWRTTDWIPSSQILVRVLSPATHRTWVSSRYRRYGTWPSRRPTCTMGASRPWSKWWSTTTVAASLLRRSVRS
ncbi:MAG: cytochrome-c peroxidase [Flavobacteriales bacterium]|nr:cytochrome-c peroxidase [Flavobacteriales bacterium]